MSVFYLNNFYSSITKVCGGPEITLACNWPELPKKGFPIIFHGIVGKDEREASSPRIELKTCKPADSYFMLIIITICFLPVAGYFNVQEIDLVLSYVGKLLQDRLSGRKINQKEIGIVTPYRKQIGLVIPVGRPPVRLVIPVGRPPIRLVIPVGRPPVRLVIPVGRPPVRLVIPVGRPPVGLLIPVGRPPVGLVIPVGRLPVGFGDTCRKATGRIGDTCRKATGRIGDTCRKTVLKLPKIDEEEVASQSSQNEDDNNGRAQKFKQAMNKKNWQEVSVGSVEEFQGQERLIIIISTVRSSHELLEDDYKFRLGFLDNPKRFNVAMTRAKSLLIVVGNPNILQCDYYWHQLLNYCHKNNAYRGVKFPLHEKSPVDRLIVDMKQLDINTDVMNSKEEGPQWRGEL
uniref:DNA2/NAM7 helicase-like C-terminal domain-containing protein n=1 Tax=Timema shepardi TaxID=629360 RepID=A0A7R9ASU7_TIMSH|nr:unnamed protein product [Timema shepardi]